MEIEIRIVKPRISNFEVVKGKNALEEVVYSARMSGVPPEIQGEDVFRMMINNDYGSALEHIIVKFDLKPVKHKLSYQQQLVLYQPANNLQPFPVKSERHQH